MQVKMLLGILPSDALLMSHGLTEYVDIKNAMKTGVCVTLLQSALALDFLADIQGGLEVQWQVQSVPSKTWNASIR